MEIVPSECSFMFHFLVPFCKYGGDRAGYSLRRAVTVAMIVFRLQQKRVN